MFIFLKIILVILCSFIDGIILAQISSNDSLFLINGKISGVKSDWIFINYYRDKELRSDSIYVQNNNFIYKGIISEPTKATFKFQNEEVTFYIDFGVMLFNANIDSFSKAKLIGSNTNDDIIRRTELFQLRKTYNENARISEDISTLMFKSDSIFIDQNPNSYYSILLLDYHFSDLNYDFIITNYRRNTIKNQNSEKGQELYNKIKESEKTLIGTYIDQFDFMDIYDNRTSIRDISEKSKFILIEFWASWCIPCRENSPFLNSLFIQYKNKGLAVLTISIDSKQGDWKKAIYKDKMEHYINGIDNSEKSLQSLFGIITIPITFLIGKDGKIIGKYNGRRNSLLQLEAKLSELLN